MTVGAAALGSVDVDALLARCAFPAGPAVACGLSGGPDSAALVALARAAGLEVTAWHVDHGLRPDATADAALAETQADRLGAAFELRRVEVAAGPDLEARAREARYRALPPDVCVGHTADDRAETVLVNLARGSGLAGVAAPHGRVRRPLLGLRRAETHALCARLGLEVADDPMNHDRDFARVAVRAEVLPALARALGRDPVPMLVRHADHAADAAAVIDDLAAALDPTDAVALAAAPRAVAGAAVRRWVAAELGDVRGLDTASVDRVLDVAAGEAVATEIVGGHRVARTNQRLRLDPTSGHPGSLR